MKKLLSYLFVIAAILSFKINVFAFDRDYNVKDYSETLSEKQVKKLQDLAEEMYDDKGLELIILIFNEGYTDYELKSIAYAYFDDEYYNDYGIYLALDIYDPYNEGYYFHFDGSKKYFSEKELDAILADIREVKNDGAYAIAKQCAESAYDNADEEKSYFGYIMLVVLPFVISGITIAVLISKNKMVRKATTAQAYLNKDEINITKKEDRFITTHVTRVPINTSSGGSHSGGSRGFSGGRGGRL